MALNIPFICFLVSALVGSVQGNYVYSYSEEVRKTKPFEKYSGLSLVDTLPYLVTDGEVDYHQCIRQCNSEEPTCKSINVAKIGDTFTCSYFNTSSGTFEKNKDSIFISKDSPTCHNYCYEMEFLNLCGECKCTDKCGSIFSHYCDCRSALPEPKKNCKAIFESGFKEPALYNLKDENGNTFEGYCEVREDPNILWLTMLRRFREKINVNLDMDKLVSGFGKPHGAVHWLGLERLHHFTQSDNTILRIEVATFSNHYKWYGEYGNFKVTKHNNNNYGYTASDFRSNYCLWDGLKEKGTFKACNGDRPWDGVCDSSPFHSKGIRWAGFICQRITFLLRHGLLPPLPVLTKEMGVKPTPRNLGLIEKFGMDFCISFDMYINNPYPEGTWSYPLLLRSQTTENTLLAFIMGPNVFGVRPIFHLGKDKRNRYFKPLIKTWMHVKVSKMRTSLTGDYTLRVVVDGVEKIRLVQDDVHDQEKVEVIFGTDIRGVAFDGLWHGLFINGRQFL